MLMSTEQLSPLSTTSQEACNVLADILVKNGFTNVVISPGSRNAPLTVALSRRKEICTYVVVDERSAAFMALGMAIEQHKPTVLVCTSGSAVLNYSPAIAEAYYRKVPLIVVSADRPEPWIDQDDSQTIRQFLALDNIVKRSYDIPSTYFSDDEKWYVNRLINDACVLSVSQPMAPVHINFHLAEPLYQTSTRSNSNSTRVVKLVESDNNLSQADIEHLANEYNRARRVMIIGGFYDYNEKLNKCIRQLSHDSRTVVLAETVTNIYGDDIVRTIDRCVNQLDDNTFKPDLLITFGGALISRMVKNRLRKCNIASHWHIGTTDHLIDIVKALTTTINVSPESFFAQLLPLISNSDSNYHDKWKEAASTARAKHDSLLASTKWCDLKAFATIISHIKHHTLTLHASNGTSIRYLHLFGDEFTMTNYCNRGVSGIDGCTSTALGAALASSTTNLLISGDMSLTYDLGALSSNYKPDNFKIIVMMNGGGGIFRFLKGPSSLPELEKYFELNINYDIRKYADAFGYRFFSADCVESLEKELPLFLNSDCASILAIYTPKELNAKVLRDYFDNLTTN